MNSNLFLVLLTCNFARSDIDILESEYDPFYETDNLVIGAQYVNAFRQPYLSGPSSSYCVRFVTHFLETDNGMGASNRLVSLTKWTDAEKAVQDLVMGFSARIPSNLAWFGHPRERGSFR